MRDGVRICPGGLKTAYGACLVGGGVASGVNFGSLCAQVLDRSGG